jgi:hypothetical protein
MAKIFIAGCGESELDDCQSQFRCPITVSRQGLKTYRGCAFVFCEKL